MGRTGRRTLGSLGAALLALVALAGCGTDDQAARDQANGAAGSDKPLGVVKAEESIDDAVDRIDEALESGKCEPLNELNPLSRPNLATDERCEFLRDRLSRRLIDAESFDGGGVIDYVFGQSGATAVAIVDHDGLFHVAVVDHLLDGQSVGTEHASKAFEAAATRASAALETRDCDAFIAAAHRRLGPGSAADRDVTCTFVKNNALGNLLEAHPKAELGFLGGNRDYAFYGIGSPTLHLTMVLARQADPRNLPEGLDPLPKDAAEYAFVDLYVTNRPGPPEQP